MPLTPFHCGPGALAKSLAPRWFSFRAFVLSQFVIDCETAWNIYRGAPQLHTFFHSYFGVTVAMAITAVLLVIYNWLVRNVLRPRISFSFDGWCAPFEIKSSAIALFFGGWSHVVLDSVMHVDMRPLAPFSGSNELLGIISTRVLHLACLWSFVGAALFWWLGSVYRKTRAGS